MYITNTLSQYFKISFSLIFTYFSGTGATLHPRSGGCTGAGGPRGATPRSRPGGVAVRRYPCPKKRNPSKTVGVARGHQRADTLKP